MEPPIPVEGLQARSEAEEADWESMAELVLTGELQVDLLGWLAVEL